MKKRNKILIGVIALLVIPIFLFIWQFRVFWFASSGPSYFQASLPTSATDIQEEYVDIFPDGTLYLKARLPSDEYNKYIAFVGLTPLTNTPPQLSWLMWSKTGSNWGATPPDWWDASSSNLTSAGGCNSGSGALAKIENGYLYLIEWTN